MGGCNSKMREILEMDDDNTSPFYQTATVISYNDQKATNTTIDSRIPIKFLCPSNHQVSSVRRLIPAVDVRCGACGNSYKKRDYIPYFTCSECQYQACAKCFKGAFKHEDICSDPQLKFWKQRTAPINCECSFCGKMVIAVVYCKSCQFFACLKCMKPERQPKCSHKFKFVDQKEVPCFSCQRKVRCSFECQKCRVELCKKCCKQELEKQQRQ